MGALRTRGAPVALTLLAAALSACGSVDVDKTGTPATATPTVLRVGSVDTDGAYLGYFADAVTRGSGGRLRLELDLSTYGTETPGGPARLPKDVRSGAVPLAYVPSRDWMATGDPWFRAAHTPFLLSTTASAIALAQGPLAAEMLDGLSAYGVHGLVMIPDEARRLTLKTPPATIADLAGQKVRINDNPQTADLLTAFGAQPVQGLVSAQTQAALAQGGLDGVESSPKYVASNSYNEEAPYLTGYGLFPRLRILMVNARAWAGLTSGQQQVLADAATEALARAAKEIPAEEADTLEQLCRNGTVVMTPTPDAWRALLAGGAKARPRDSQVLALADRIEGAVPGAGPQTTASPLPADCPTAQTRAQAEALHRKPGAVAGAAVPDPSGTFPTGTYRVTITPEQVGSVGRPPTEDITYTWVFKADGTFTETQQPDYPSQGPQSGRWQVTGDQITLTYAHSPTGTLPPETVRWSYFKGELRFVVVAVQDNGSRVIYGQPWRKVG